MKTKDDSLITKQETDIFREQLLNSDGVLSDSDKNEALKALGVVDKCGGDLLAAMKSIKEGKQ